MLYRFSSFNCKGVKRSVDTVRELCQNSDLVAVQETWLMPDDIAYLDTFDYNFCSTGTSAVDTAAGMLRGRPHGGVGLLWRRTAFQSVSVVQCSNMRLCAVKIMTNDNRHLIVVSVYMPTDCSENLAEFTDCLGAVSAIIEEHGIESVFLMGDFNAHPNERFYNEMINYCNEQKWCCVDVNNLGINSDTYTFISDAHLCRRWLDHFVLTQAAVPSVRKVYVKHCVTWSDHLPIVLECDLDIIVPKITSEINKGNKNVIWGERTMEQIDLYNKECHKRLRLIEFPSDLRQCGDKCCREPSHRHVLNALYNDIVFSLRTAATVGREEKQCKAKQRIVGWNRHVKEAHMVARQWFNEWIVFGKPTNGILYRKMCETRKIFKSRLKWCQDHQKQIKLDIISSHHSKKHFKSFWKSTNKLKPLTGLPSGVDGVSDPKTVANLFRDHFVVKSPLGPTMPEGFDGDTCSEDVGPRITARSIDKAIKSMHKGKSPGHDGLSIEHLQHAGPHISRLLAMFYTLCIRHSYLPDDLMRTIVIPVVKNKTGDLADRNNYRPISLATIIAKILDSVLNSQLSERVELHDNQFGFRPGLSTEAAILSLKHTVKYYTTRRTPVIACFLDLSKAFDLVSYKILWKKLEDTGLPPETVNILKYWYGSQVNSVRWANAMSDEYRLECGVRQGGLSSPTLFNLYINGLIETLSNTHVGCHIDGVCVNNLSYADDMVLLSASVCGIRRMLKICEAYATDHGLKYNGSKSQYMVFETDRKNTIELPSIYLNDALLERVDSFKYLGHIVAVDLRDDMDLERERRALSVRANMIARRFAGCSIEVKATLFRAFCTSLYTCCLWAQYTQRAYGALRVQYNNAFRVLMGLPRFCSASGMFAAARVNCFHTVMRGRTASLMRRVRSSPNIILKMIAERVDCVYLSHCGRLHSPTSIVKW
ncbi:uncharacterized protein LOC133526321 [Cydia pomonella]|uniref:uncharacterized protein LOC133526321 n=1 Tax=Cydia pomonella TaxID=82600 RepID=UPI002ADE9446|nr:uncharacterized protein LOC133526321 [Cydia pomonella]